MVDVLVDTVANGAGQGGASNGAGQGGIAGESPAVEGRAAHQAPEVDGTTSLVAEALGQRSAADPQAGLLTALRPGDLVRARVVGTEGVDLLAVPVEMLSAAPAGRP
jgi:hypothetical protein